MDAGSEVQNVLAEQTGSSGSVIWGRSALYPSGLGLGFAGL